ncbi:unnamed protein product [Cuscuta epithymum]|uniref:ABC-type xenobiotic transporter n=1 Tax=Cuscuta epithymum TaxID=186058 RepID=A0AAV0DD93_9ASTE|nr:unnamed protein product [Cuscuta epithymum]
MSGFLLSHQFSWSFVEGDPLVINPVFLRAVSASLHVVLSLYLLIHCWSVKKAKNNGVEHIEEDQTDDHDMGGRVPKPNFRHLKTALLSCLSLSLLNFVLCFLSQFYWYRNGWSDEKTLTLLDFSIKTITWLAIFSVLLTQLSSGEMIKYPFVLRVWWGFFFALSCYCLAVDVVYYKKNGNLPTQYWISDVVSSVLGLLLCLVCILGGKEGGYELLRQPLLNVGGRNVSQVNELSSGDETVTPFAKANFYSKLTFSWMGPLISVGRKKTLDLEDVPQLSGLDSVIGAYPIFQDNVVETASEGRDSNKLTTSMLVKALVLTAWKDILLSACYAACNTLASYVGPYLIDTFVKFLNGNLESRGQNEGYLLVSVFFVAKIVECLSMRHWGFKVQQAGYRGHATLVAKIHDKSLTLSCHSKQTYTSGEIINFMTVDAERIGDFGWYMHDPWIVLLQVGLALAVLYKNLGLASVAALVSTVIVMLANIPLGKLEENFQEKLMKSKDTRMKAMSEVLRNMRILKLQAWEMKFFSKIILLRNNEAGWLKKFVYTSSMSSCVFWMAPTFVSLATFVTAMLMGIPLESGKVLSALATFRILQLAIYNLPDTVSYMVQTKVSLDRIALFLSLDELKPNSKEKLRRGSSDVSIEIVEGNFSWIEHPTPTQLLKDINLRVHNGMRVAICGTVGSGKSSLLTCILGEMPRISGSVMICGTKAYISQSPWIQSGKIEENILFGKKMDREKYETVIEACCLKKDLEVFSFGDQTIIGERGINLSGGQKQRVQIARALYQDADIYLFDDPFSAVDAHTGTHLFNECILGLLKSKTVVYVTHQIEYLPAADLILVMKDGRVSQSGKYNDILNLGSDFMELVGAHKEALSVIDDFGGREGVTSKVNSSLTSNKSTMFQNEEEGDSGQSGKPNNALEPKVQLVQEEEREKGSVSLSVYWKYIRTAYGGALVPFILAAHILFQALQIGSNYWITWATSVSELEKPPVGSRTLIIVYVCLAIGSSFCILGRSVLLATAGYKTATQLFIKMHQCIFRAPMSFFDATPCGRILNRASTDQSAVDLDIPFQVGTFAFTMIQLASIIAVMSQVAWQVFVVFIPVIAMCIYLEQYYIPSARELARFVGVCKAPIIQHFAETISGSTTIRSFEQEARFRDLNMKLIDAYNRPKFHTAGAMEWLCFRLDMLSLVTFAFSLVFLISVPVGTINASVAGLAVTYGLNLNMLQTSVIWNLCRMQNKIISVERILQYNTIPIEPPLIVESNRPDPDWPSTGEVDIRNLQVRYAPHMPLVLRGITCTLFGGKKTGVVGRTGSGKSTLIQTIFRIVEPAYGEIAIDGVNLSTIGLHDLRSRLSIIPQDPTMFEGTVRSNLDPLEEYSDEQIWEALDKCQLGDEVRKKDGKLDSAVTENGENWSMGQRQLVCLGRVLLKKSSKILVLDEATASVDTSTDNLIQRTLNEHFSHSTVITIAHRITSVLDSNMVLLLDHGVIGEYDTPENLLENRSSLFAKLVAEYSTRSSCSFEKLS